MSVVAGWEYKNKELSSWKEDEMGIDGLPLALWHLLPYLVVEQESSIAFLEWTRRVQDWRSWAQAYSFGNLFILPADSAAKEITVASTVDYQRASVSI